MGKEERCEKCPGNGPNASCCTCSKVMTCLQNQFWNDLASKYGTPKNDNGKGGGGCFLNKQRKKLEQRDCQKGGPAGCGTPHKNKKSKNKDDCFLIDEKIPKK